MLMDQQTLGAEESFETTKSKPFNSPPNVGGPINLNMIGTQGSKHNLGFTMFPGQYNET